MEGLTRLVSESLARHGFDRPLDYRRLHWSRWFRCESPHSLLFVPSKPGVFAVAEEILPLSDTHVGTDARVATDAFVRPTRDVGTDAFVRPASAASAPMLNRVSDPLVSGKARPALSPEAESRKPDVAPRRMLAVTQFFEDDDMAFVLDRMLSRQNPMRARLISGRYFVRFVVIEDQAQRRTICTALNQWMVTAAEKATGIGSHFATSLELTPATEHIDVGRDVNGDVTQDMKGDVARDVKADVGRDMEGDVGRALLPATADATNAPVVTAHVETVDVETPDVETAGVEATPLEAPDAETAHVETAASAVPPAQSAAAPITPPTPAIPIPTSPRFAPGAVINLHSPTLFPSGF